MKQRSGRSPEILKKSGVHEKSKKAKRKDDKQALKKEVKNDYCDK